MANYKLSKEAIKDLIRIHHYGVEKFGMQQADKYFYSFFDQFEIIAKRPFAFESVGHINTQYRRCVFGSDSIIRYSSYVRTVFILLDNLTQSCVARKSSIPLIDEGGLDEWFA